MNLNAILDNLCEAYLPHLIPDRVSAKDFFTKLVQKCLNVQCLCSTEAGVISQVVTLHIIDTITRSIM